MRIPRTPARRQDLDPRGSDAQPPSEAPPPSEELLAVISHELATPLAVIESAATLALGGDTHLDDEQQELLEVILRNSEHASRLLKRLHLAREGATDDLALERVDLGQLAREAAQDVARVVTAGHSVDVTADGDVVADADPAAIREILFNLLANAAKYSAPGADIDVRVAPLDAEVEIVVRNHGSGVTPGDTERIFEKFTQGQESRSGAGLGLFVSRRLARAHGGDLAVRPAAAVGSEFRLTLPVRVSAGS